MQQKLSLDSAETIPPAITQGPQAVNRRGRGAPAEGKILSYQILTHTNLELDLGVEAAAKGGLHRLLPDRSERSLKEAGIPGKWSAIRGIELIGVNQIGPAAGTRGGTLNPFSVRDGTSFSGRHGPSRRITRGEDSLKEQNVNRAIEECHIEKSV